jgi:hypothetical protein
MPTMRNRLQILIDDERLTVLERESQRTGRSVARLVRDAVDVHYGVDRDARRVAYEELLAAPPMPVDDWDVMKGELLDTFYDGG